MVKVAPSVLSADFGNIKDQLAQIKQGGAKWLHFDVMDGHFVPNLTFGPKILSDIKRNSDLFMDVHIMVSDPKRVYPWFHEADLITFHYEALSNDAERFALIEEIASDGILVGISIKPDTKVESLVDLLPHVDLVLIMSVEPGFGGQAFIPSALDKVRYLSLKKKENGYRYLIQIDGGINRETALEAKEAGVEVLVAGSYVFKGDIVSNVRNLL